MSETKRKTIRKNTSKLAQYFPTIRSKEEILNDVKAKPALVSMFYDWTS